MDRLEYIESHRGSLSYVVGKKSDYYLNAWSMEKTKINFAAFFLEAFWFAYRKMYRYAMILATINILITLISLQFIFGDRLLFSRKYSNNRNKNLCRL